MKPLFFPPFTQFMYPRRSKGVNIHYDREFYEKCPKHGTTTYGTDDPHQVWCPFCMHLLKIRHPF